MKSQTLQRQPPRRPKSAFLIFPATLQSHHHSVIGKKENQGSERLNSLAKVTQLLSNGAKAWIQGSFKSRALWLTDFSGKFSGTEGSVHLFPKANFTWLWNSNLLTASYLFLKCWGKFAKFWKVHLWASRIRFEVGDNRACGGGSVSLHILVEWDWEKPRSMKVVIQLPRQAGLTQGVCSRNPAQRRHCGPAWRERRRHQMGLSVTSLG